VTERSDKRTGIVASFGVHLLLLLLFLIWRMQIHPFVLDFTPVNFAPLMDLKEAGQSALAALEAGTPVVELPRRPMLEETSPLLQLPDRARPPIEATIPRERPDEPRLDLPSAGRRMLLPTETVGRSDRPVSSPLSVNDSWVEGERRQAAAGKLTGDEMFSISWEGPSRTKISGDLPTFPPGVNRAVTVKLAIDVAPDGTVLFVTPATKGVPELEKVSINAVRSWRFNALDPSQAQLKQRGEITFIFKLK